MKHKQRCMNVNGTTKAFWKFWKRKHPPDPLVDCQEQSDCQEGYCCSRSKRRCVRWADPLASSDCDVSPTHHIGSLPTRGRSDYPMYWDKKPGENGFNQYALSLLHKAGINRTLSCRMQDGDRWYQRVRDS